VKVGLTFVTGLTMLVVTFVTGLTMLDVTFVAKIKGKQNETHCTTKYFHMTGHIPLNALLAQTIPRTTLGSILSTVSSPSPVLTTTANQGSSSLQLMSLAQMTPGTQLLSPMSPALQLGATGLTQAQLSQMLLKQIPIFTPGLLQAGQVQSMIPSSLTREISFFSLKNITYCFVTSIMKLITFLAKNKLIGNNLTSINH
jgi:hypothetical protein